MNNLEAQQRPIARPPRVCAYSANRVLTAFLLSLEVASTTGASNAYLGWGWNNHGQSMIPAGTSFVSIAAGNLHTVGLREDGTVVGWGLNTFGQASPPSGLGNVVQIAAGGWYQLPGEDLRAHSAALLSDGTVRVWGNNQHGQCNVPAGLGPVVQVECGWAHTAVLTSGRSVMVWGAGDAGVNADPHWGQRFVPTNLGAIDSISTKGCHIMALRSDGTVRCWGRNQEGQCSTPALTGIIAIAAGSDHSMALAADGVVTCWGWDFFQQVSAQPPGERFRSIAASMYGSVGLTVDGRVLRWGNLDGPPSGVQCAEKVVAGGFHAFVDLGSDCNSDGIGDCEQVRNGSLPDYDGDSIPDCCEAGTPCTVGNYPVQWRVEDGGNGHWYRLERAGGAIAWNDARRAAIETGGDLATFTSGEETAHFISMNAAVTGVIPWIGLWQDMSDPDFSEPAGGWKWVTGESLDWTNWNATEPNDAWGGGEHWANIWMTDFGTAGTWNDYTPDYSGGVPNGYVIEWSADCDADGVVDYGQILLGQVADINGNGIPDTCDCPADINQSGNIDAEDLAYVLFAWGMTGSKAGGADINGDATVDASDLSLVLGSWGPCPN